jgi:hypothetical protein
MMLRHLQFNDQAERIHNAILQTIAEGKYRTADLGGKSSTSDYTKAVCDHIWGPAAVFFALEIIPDRQFCWRGLDGLITWNTRKTTSR